MRPLYDDFDDYDFADSEVVRQMLREQQREELRLHRRWAGPRKSRRTDDLDDDHDKFDDYEEFDEYDEYDDYNADEFDSYSERSNGR